MRSKTKELSILVFLARPVAQLVPIHQLTSVFLAILAVSYRTETVFLVVLNAKCASATQIIVLRHALLANMFWDLLVFQAVHHLII